MDLLLPLWLPILLSSVAVWFVSIIASMALPHNRQDWIALPNPPGEDGFMDYLRKSDIKPGNYLFPDFRSSEAMKSAKVEKALNEGPVGHLSVWRTPLTMGDKLVGTFIVYLVVSILIAYLSLVAIQPVASPASFAKVFQITATAGVLAYGFSFIPSALWWGSYTRTIIANTVDGVVYGVMTGAIFAWLWPR